MPLKQRINNSNKINKFKKDNNPKMFDYDKEIIRKKRKQKMSLYESDDYPMADYLSDDNIIPDFNFNEHDKKHQDDFNVPALIVNREYTIYYYCIYSGKEEGSNKVLKINTSFVNLLTLLPELNKLNPEGKYRLDL